jgi:hypothetical protein
LPISDSYEKPESAHECGFAVIRGTENGRQVNFLYAFSV